MSFYASEILSDLEIAQENAEICADCDANGGVCAEHDGEPPDIDGDWRSGI